MTTDNAIPHVRTGSRCLYDYEKVLESIRVKERGAKMKRHSRK